MEQPTLRTSSTGKLKRLFFHFLNPTTVLTIVEDVVDNDWCVAVLRSERAVLTIWYHPTIVLDTGFSAAVHTVVFHPDGIHMLGGGDAGIRRWRLADGQEVGKQTGMELRAISVSRDHRWIVCGTTSGTSVWDAELREKLIDAEGTNTVIAVDVSPDSTRFATGTEKDASIWSIPSGVRLVGPLKHNNWVAGIKFSPNGEHIASMEKSIRVFDSHTGDELMSITTTAPSQLINTPLAWSNDSRQIFAASKDNKIKCFEVSTGSLLAKSQTLDGGDVESVALATSGKFIATYASSAIYFLDTSTLTEIGPVIKDSTTIYSITLSLDSSYLATGRLGKVAIHKLVNILPDFYGDSHVVSIWLPFRLLR